MRQPERDHESCALRPYHGGMRDDAGGTVLLAAPRGYCAGVERAVDAVERALAKHGAPVYVRKQIVHNLHVVRDLESKGAIFVDEETEVPEGAVVVLSAHGVAPWVYENAGDRELEVIDATCPLVTKVHVEARRFASRGPHDRADRARRVTRRSRARAARRPSARSSCSRPSEARTVEIADPDEPALPDPDHAVGRRDERDRAHPHGAVPRDRGTRRATTSATRRRTDRTR